MKRKFLLMAFMAMASLYGSAQTKEKGALPPPPKPPLVTKEIPVPPPPPPLVVKSKETEPPPPLPPPMIEKPEKPKAVKKDKQ